MAPLRDTEPKLLLLSPISFAASRRRCAAIVSRLLALPYLRFMRGRILTQVLQHIQPGVSVGRENQAVGRDVEVGSLCRKGDLGPRVDHLLWRRRHPTGDLFGGEGGPG